MQESRSLSIKEKLVGLGQNLKYWMRSFAHQYSLEDALQPYEAIYLLGKLYSSGLSPDKANKQIAEAFSDIIWITYRAQFPPLLKETSSQSVVTDAGWGCMIRAGQMLYAQFLRDYLKQKNSQERAMICEWFNDFKKQEIFSIQRIAQLGKSQYGLEPGQWYNAGKISNILEIMLNGCNKPVLQGLKAIVFKSSRIFLKDVLNRFQPQGHCECQDNSDLIACTKCLTSNREVAVVIISRIGLKQPQSEYLQNLSQLITWPWFRGFLGGIDEKALYFVGMKEDQYIYLDPHYVQPAVKEMGQDNQSYRCRSFRRCKNTRIAPSIGTSFYLKSLQELNNFYQALKRINKDNSCFLSWTSLSKAEEEQIQSSKSVIEINEQEAS